MKAGWKTVKLGELTSHRPICYGVLKPGKRQEEGVPLIRITDITENKLDESDIYLITSKLSQEFGRSILTGGEVLLSIQGTIGRVAICPPHMKGANVSRTLAVIAPDERASSAYVRYWLLSLNGTLPTCGSTRASLNIGAIRELEIPLPPLAEQKRIVALLDEAFAGIDEAKAMAEANMDEAKAVLQSHLESVFEKGGPDWVEEPLSECLDLITYGFTNPMPTTTEGPYMITAKNIVGGRIDYESSRRTSQQAFDSLLTDKSRPKVGDVLLTKDGTLGRVAVVDRPHICVNQSVAVLRMNGKVFPPFMRDLLSSYGYQKRMIEDAGGTTIKHIYITRVDKMPVKFPASITDQKKLVDALEMAATEAQKLFNVFEKKVSAYGQLKNSLLSQAFAGDLTA